MDGVSSNAGRSLANAPISLGARISTSMVKMEQDQQKADGEAAVQLMKAAGEVQAKEPGKGDELDVMG